jgi:DNA-binding transcriptional ArsR family regulator
MKETDFRICRIFRALGNPLRYRILFRLAASPATPKTLAIELCRPLTTVSNHLAILRSLGLVRYQPHAPTCLYAHKYGALQELLGAGASILEEVQAGVSTDPMQVPA